MNLDFEDTKWKLAKLIVALNESKLAAAGAAAVATTATAATAAAVAREMYL